MQWQVRQAAQGGSSQAERQAVAAAISSVAEGARQISSGSCRMGQTRQQPHLLPPASPAAAAEASVAITLLDAVSAYNHCLVLCSALDEARSARIVPAAVSATACISDGGSWVLKRTGRLSTANPRGPLMHASGVAATGPAGGSSSAAPASMCTDTAGLCWRKLARVPRHWESRNFPASLQTTSELNMWYDCSSAIADSSQVVGCGSMSTVQLALSKTAPSVTGTCGCTRPNIMGCHTVSIC